MNQATESKKTPKNLRYSGCRLIDHPLSYHLDQLSAVLILLVLAYPQIMFYPLCEPPNKYWTQIVPLDTKIAIELVVNIKF
jgi:hypothetical protein